MVGYREKPNLRNARRSVVWPMENVPSPIGTLIVYKERKIHLAQHPEDENTFARVYPITEGYRKGDFACVSESEARRLGYLTGKES
ncbi:MAG: hypothetical protein J4400_04570 [Candidatus Aenigmarchaeota archaeon]|nr:hypothetical protein [Candidatus Aenigmarchaeota archaeon]